MARDFGARTDQRLLEALRKASTRRLSQAELEEQRVSFVYSAMSERAHVTRDQVREILKDQRG